MTVDLLTVAEKLTHFAHEQHGDSIAIIAIYGSYALGDATSESDLDMYAITDTKDKKKPVEYNLFVNNRPVDLWNLSWKKAEALASATNDFPEIWAVAASIFVNSKVLYARSPQDSDRYEQLKQSIITIQQDLSGNVSFVVNSFNRSWGIERLDAAKQRNDLLFARWYGWNFINDMCMWLARLNNTFYTKNWGSNLEQVFRLPLIPSNLKERLEILAITEDFDLLKKTILSLKQDLRSLIRAQQEKTRVERMTLKTDVLAGILEYINKAKKGCRTKDILLASYAASELQTWVMQLTRLVEGLPGHNFNFSEEIASPFTQHDFPDISKAVSSRDFAIITEAVELFEQKILVYFHTQGKNLANLESLPEVDTYLEKIYPNS